MLCCMIFPHLSLAAFQSGRGLEVIIWDALLYDLPTSVISCVSKGSVLKVIIWDALLHDLFLSVISSVSIGKGVKGDHLR